MQEESIRGTSPPPEPGPRIGVIPSPVDSQAPSSPSPKAYGHRRSGSGDSQHPSRPASIYTLSRASFASQLAQLTAVQLPNAAALSARIPSLPTAIAAASALSEAANQIKSWIRKATGVLKDLNAEDDVEWAAAAGRDGIEEMGQDTAQLDALIASYVGAVENLHTRPDVSSLTNETMTGCVAQLDSIVLTWQAVKDRLQNIKSQEELAVEWQELSNTVLADISRELDSLADLVFRMEEQRHISKNAMPGRATSGREMDVDELVYLVDRHNDSPAEATRSRPNVPAMSATSTTGDTAEESNVVALFARMQPLKASLDFLPMRLSGFRIRAEKIFPTACLELDSTRDQLTEQLRKLESDAEALRIELGEDKWIAVFRNAGCQALNMFDSLERTQGKLRDLLRRGLEHTDLATLSRMTESFRQKKTHYVPAIEKVLNIIDRGVLGRLTVNGEILQLQTNMKRRWTGLMTSMASTDALIADGSRRSRPGNDLRDSVSSILSSELSNTSSNGDTTRSSPASSVISQGRKGSFNQNNATPKTLTKSRLPRASLLTPTTLGQPTYSRALRSLEQRSVTSPSPYRRDVYGSREVGLVKEDEVRQLPTLTPSPRKYSSHYRAGEASRYSSVGSNLGTLSPTPAADDNIKLPNVPIRPRYTSRVSLPVRAASSFGLRSPSVSNLANPKTRTPAGEIGQQQQGRSAQSPMRAKRNGSFASFAESGLGPSKVDSPRPYPPSASRNISRPSTSFAPGYGDSQTPSGRRSSLAGYARGYAYLSVIPGGQSEKPRWRF